MNPLSENKALWRSIHSLTHPISILAVLLLLFNDHYLRHVSPSWITGKLGDFTWLLFAPFIAGLVFALLIPRRVQNHERVVGFASIGFIGVWFATAKTIPFVHHITTSAFEWLVGWQGQLRLDVTDLLTLPALLISWYIWRTVPNTEINLKPYAPIIIALAILGTLASDNVPDQGVTCILQDNGTLYARTYDGHYFSGDGGYNWQPFTESITFDCPYSYYYDGARVAEWSLETDSGETIYDVYPGERISVFRGRPTTYDLTQYRLDMRDAYYGRQPLFVDYLVGPVHGIHHSESGNLIFAMSLDGILIITLENEHIWVDVGEYSYQELTESDVFALIDGVFLLAVGLFALAGLTLLSHHSWGMTTLLALMWLVWVFGAYIYSPNMEFYEFYLLMGSICTLIVGLSFCLSLGRAFFNKRKVVIPVLLLTTAITLAFILPHILWVESRIPDFTFAKTFATVPLALTVLFAYFRIHNRYFSRPNRPRSVEEISDMIYEMRDTDLDNHDINSTVDPFESE